MYHLPITRPTDFEPRLLSRTYLVKVSRQKQYYLIIVRSIDWRGEKTFAAVLNLRVVHSFIRHSSRVEVGLERGYEFSELDHRTNNSKQPHGLSNLIQHSRAARMFYSNSSQLRSERCNTHAAHPSRPLDRW